MVVGRAFNCSMVRLAVVGRGTLFMRASDGAKRIRPSGGQHVKT